MSTPSHLPSSVSLRDVSLRDGLQDEAPITIDAKVAIFEALLHEDQKYENALVSRRTMNFAASRRKVKLFLVEDPNLPIYKVSRVVEESPKQVRFYIYNNSEGGMPTPCEVRMDDNMKKWRIGICSL